METWNWLVTEPASANWNMAFDEALLSTANHRGVSVVRFYSWEGKPASFGYFQKLKDVESLTTLRPLVRRCSGGGVVEHAEDWTYSVAIPSRHSWWMKSAESSYRDIHLWCAEALVEVGIPASLAPEADPSGPGCCFIGAERSDILVNGVKIGGAAQRRNQNGLLIQGSIQGIPSVDSVFSDWIQAMVACAPGPVTPWLDWEDNPAFTQCLNTLVHEKYSSPAWLNKR
ncbi:MAG: hypothetical protein LR011_03340 [Verrucomicrobia bacterium]|nr:hypothetical protein [Verrucomicrobiota bacterium]